MHWGCDWQAREVMAGIMVDDGWMGRGRAEAKPSDILAALRVYRLACAIQAGLIAVLLVWLM